MNNQENKYETVWYQLQKKVQDDELFKMDLQAIYYFYESKLLNMTRSETQKELIKNRFEDVVFSQIFQGYYTMKTILEDQELELDDAVWKMKESFSRNEIPVFLNNIFKQDNVDWSHTDVSHALGMDILNDFEIAYEVFEKTRVEIACYGAFKAFLDDPRYEIQVKDPEAVTKLGNPLELEFLTPQVYMNVFAVTDENEIWNMHYWSGTQSDTWVGKAHFMQLPMNGRVVNMLTVSVLSIISKNEREMLLNQLISRIPVEYQTDLQTYLYHIEDFDMFFPYADTDDDIDSDAYNVGTTEFLTH